MQTKTRIGLSVLLITGLLAMGVAGSSPAPNTDSGPVVKVTGRATAMVEPDQMKMTVVVATEGEGPAIQAQNASKTEKVLAAIRAKGIPATDIETSDARYFPVTVWDPETGESRISRYRAQHHLQVTVKDVTKAGGVMDAAIQAGAESVEQIQFILSDGLKARYGKQLIESAVRDGKAKAEAAAGAAGVTLDGVWEIVVREAQGQQIYMEDARAGMGEKDQAPTELYAGDIQLEAVVDQTYRLRN